MKNYQVKLQFFGIKDSTVSLTLVFKTQIDLMTSGLQFLLSQ